MSIWISEQGEVPFTLIEDEPMKMEASVTFYWLFFLRVRSKTLDHTTENGYIARNLTLAFYLTIHII